MARRVVSHYREHMTPDDLSSPEEELLKFANHILRTPGGSLETDEVP